MKKLLILGAALLGLCVPSQTTARAGDDREYCTTREHREYSRDYDDDDDCPPPRCYEGRVVERRYYAPRVVLPLPPLPFVYGRSYHHRHHYRSHGYGYYRPGVHIGIGF